MPRSNKRFSIYDQMEEAGVFDTNPANSYARDPKTGVSIYKRQDYPKRMYHPEAEEEVIKTGVTQFSAQHGKPIYMNEQKAMVHREVSSPEEEDELRAEGWHDHPAKALQAAGKKAPAFVPQMIENSESEAKLAAERAKVKAMEAELAEMRAALEASKAAERSKQK